VPDLLRPTLRPTLRPPKALPLTPAKGGGFSLASLFRAGEDGFLFYPMSDLTRLFLLSNGSTGNAAVDTDPIGLDLDNHGWGASDLTATLAVQSELLVPGSWSMSVAGGTSTATESPAGQLNLNGDGTNQARGDQSFTTVVGKTYRLSFTSATTGASADVGTTQGAANVTTVAGGIGATTFYFVAQSTTTWVRLRRTSGLSTVTSISCKLVPGNHALQATTTRRPLYKTNSGKPYLSFDGSDDVLQSSFAPTAAMTMAIAFNSATDGGILMGGGNSTGNFRAYVAAVSGGKFAAGWGAQSSAVIQGGSGALNSDHVGLMTVDATSVDLWLDGALVYSQPPSGTGSGGGGVPTVAIGGWNNGGTPSTWSAMRAYAALALNRRVTAAEITGITSLFQRTYQ